MRWGLAGPKLGGYDIPENEDTTLAWLLFLIKNGFSSTGIPLHEVEDPAQLERVAALVAEHDLQISIPVESFPVMSVDADDVKRTTDTFLARLMRVKEQLRVPIVTLTSGSYHRFMREPTLDEQLDRLSRNLADLAQECHRLGSPLGIENHGDYYCSDLVVLCKRVAHLGIFLDTGNCFLTGEKPVPACREAAPYTIGTHFKDHFVWPNKAVPLGFLIQGAPLGDGDVDLRQIYLDLLELHPEPGSLVMQWELIPPTEPKIPDMELLRRSWKFVRSLPSS